MGIYQKGVKFDQRMLPILSVFICWFQFIRGYFSSSSTKSKREKGRLSTRASSKSAGSVSLACSLLLQNEHLTLISSGINCWFWPPQKWLKDWILPLLTCYWNRPEDVAHALSSLCHSKYLPLGLFKQIRPQLACFGDKAAAEMQNTVCCLDADHCSLCGSLCMLLMPCQKLTWVCFSFLLTGDKSNGMGCVWFTSRKRCRWTWPSPCKLDTEVVLNEFNMLSLWIPVLRPP